MKAGLLLCALLLALLSVAVLGARRHTELEYARMFKDFAARHQRQYATAEEFSARLAAFKDNVDLIESHNERYAAGAVLYRLGVNKFADMTWDEFQRTYLTLRLDPEKESPRQGVHQPRANDVPPKEVRPALG